MESSHYSALPADGGGGTGAAAVRHSRHAAAHTQSDQPRDSRVHSDAAAAEAEAEAAREWQADGSSTGYTWRDCTRCFRSEQSPLLFVRVLYSRCQHRLLLRHRLYLCAFLLSSLLLSALLYYVNGFAASTSSSSSPAPFTCHNILWAGADACGHLARDCQPFVSAEPFDIRCAARCDWPNLSHRTVGSLPHYRPDSYVCAAAIHAGLIGTYGGCVRVAFNGPHWGFVGSAGGGGLSSESFDSWFPLSFTLSAAPGASHCGYFHWSLLFVGLALFLLLSMLRPPPVVLFYSLLLYGYYYVAATMADGSSQEAIFFTACERLFYVCTFGYCMFQLGPAVTLTLGGQHSSCKADDRQVRAADGGDSTVRLQPASHPHLTDPSQAQPSQEDSLASSLFDDDSLDSTAETPSFSFSQPSPAGRARSPLALLTCAPLRSRLSQWWFAYRGVPFTLHLPSSAPLAWYDLFFLYCLPCFAALHFGYLSMVLPDVDLNAQAFSHGLSGALVILSFSAVIVGLLLCQTRLLYYSGLLRLYCACYCCAALLVVVVSAAWHRTYSFHLHHVLVGPLLFPFTRFRSRVSLVCQSLLLGVFLNGLALWGFSADWDYTPPASPATVDDLPPAMLYVHGVRNASGAQPQPNQQLEAVWALRNDTGSALGSSLYLNGVQVFHASFVDTKAWWNSSAAATLALPPQPANMRTAAAAAVDEEAARVRHASWDGVVQRIHRYDRTHSARLYYQAVAASSHFSHAVAHSPASASHPQPSLASSVSLQRSEWDEPSGGWMGVAALPSLVLVAGWNYSLVACYTFTYGSAGPCTEPLLLQL